MPKSLVIRFLKNNSNVLRMPRTEVLLGIRDYFSALYFAQENKDMLLNTSDDGEKHFKALAKQTGTELRSWWLSKKRRI